MGSQSVRGRRPRATDCAKECWPLGDVFRAIAEHAPFGVTLIDADGGLRYMNPRFRDLFGYTTSETPTEDEWLARAFPDPSYRSEVLRAWRDDLGCISCEERPRTFRVRFRDGSERPAAFEFAGLKDGSVLLFCHGATAEGADTSPVRQQLWNTIESLPDPTFVVDRERRVIAWNRAMEEMTGVRKEEILGRGDYAYSIPFYGRPRPGLVDLLFIRDEWAEAEYEYLERRGETLYGEAVATGLPSGGETFIWAKASPIFDGDGRIVGAIESIRDITDKKRSEAALAEANEKLSAIIRASPLAILTFDMNGLVRSWNAAAERIFGWKESEVLGSYPPFVPKERMHEFRTLIGMALSGKTYTGVEVQRVRKDGATVELSLSSAPIRDARGRIQGAITLIDDISSRKAAERSLRESLHLLQRLTDTIPNPIFYKDMYGRFLGCNVAFERFVDLPRDRIIGRTVYEIYPRELADLCQAADEALLREPGIRIEEMTMRLSSGRTAEVISNKATYTNEDGSLAGLVEVLIDITERKAAEEELRAAKEAAEEAARVKAEFLANMSHEIRTPLNAVIGMTGLLLDAGLSPENRDCVETIRSSSDTLLSIINDILDFSKIDGGKMELECQPFDIESCIEEALDLVAASAAEKGLNLAYRIDERTPGTILGDLTRLRQILVNLMGNAVKFTEEGEVLVTVTSRRLVDDRHEICFSVRDTGIGISPEHTGRLFCSFSQIDASISRRYGGTGLGLAICRRLVEMMGGRIWVKSRPGRGSDFRFTIVAEVQKSDSRPHRSPCQPLLAGKRILIVDESRTNLEILEELVQHWGMQPLTSCSASDAIDLVRSEVFDAAIIGGAAEGIEADSLIGEMKEYRRTLPIILYTSFGQRVEECSQFAAVLSRPIKPALLHDAFCQIFDEKTVYATRLPGPQMATGPLLRILLAEDNVVNQKVALKMLNKLGYRADLAANGLEVLEALERLPYDVVLMDVQMPEMDGLEATRRIRQRWPQGGPRIIAITAYAMEGDRERCIDAGMDDYISKPVQIQDLSRALRRSLRGA